VFATAEEDPGPEDAWDDTAEDPDDVERSYRQ
jgi:hypothetical protein